MKINLLPIVSGLHNEQTINQDTLNLIDTIEKNSEFKFKVSDIKGFYEADLSIILVQSGGSEGYFLDMYKELKPPFYFLTYGSNNSLAASMEILSFLRDLHQQAEILHGKPDYIIERLNQMIQMKKKPMINLGVVGKPSDWLIASDVDYDECRRVLNVNLIDVSIQELIDTYESTILEDDDLYLPFNQIEVDKAKRLSQAMEKIIEKYQLKGLTLRCFDLLDRIHTTGCIGLSLLNKNGLIGTCEGDIPAMLSMHILKEVTGHPGFQANPSRIDTRTNEVIFAHCTLPLDMSDNYKVMTHYESGIGVALRGKLKTTDITVFKLGRNLVDYFVTEGIILDNLEESNLCRTQIKVKLDQSKYFLTEPLGNHHLIVYGKHKQAIDDYFKYKY